MAVSTCWHGGLTASGRVGWTKSFGNFLVCYSWGLDLCSVCVGRFEGVARRRCASAAQSDHEHCIYCFRGSCTSGIHGVEGTPPGRDNPRRNLHRSWRLPGTTVLRLLATYRLTFIIEVCWTGVVLTDLAEMYITSTLTFFKNFMLSSSLFATSLLNML